MTQAAVNEVITAAMSVAKDAAEGKLELQRTAVEECRSLFATVIGPGDAMWELQVEVARGVLSAGGGIGAGELAEWAAVARQREQSAD